jgi:hypothetical protein
MTTNPENKTTCNSKAIYENNLKCGLKCRNQARKGAQLRVREREREIKLSKEERTLATISSTVTLSQRNPKKQNQKQKTETIFIVAMFSNNFCFCKFSICCTQNTNSLYLHTQKPNMVCCMEIELQISFLHSLCFCKFNTFVLSVMSSILVF